MTLKRYVNVNREIVLEHGPSAGLVSTVFGSSPASGLYFHVYVEKKPTTAFVANDVSFQVSLTFYARAFDTKNSAIAWITMKY